MCAAGRSSFSLVVENATGEGTMRGSERSKSLSASCQINVMPLAVAPASPFQLSMVASAAGGGSSHQRVAHWRITGRSASGSPMP